LSTVLLEKLIVAHLVKKSPACYGSQRFITVYTRACHWSIPTTRCIQSTSSNPASLRSVLILSYHLRLGLPSGLFPSGFTTKTLYAFLIFPIRATCPSHLTLHNLITLTIFGEVYKLRSSSLCSLLQPPATSSLLCPNILLSTLFSNIPQSTSFPWCQRLSFIPIQNNT